MATTAKSKKRNTAAKKCTVPTRKTFSGKAYSLVKSTYKTKASAKKAADRHRGGGKSKAARVVPNPCGKGYRVYKRG